MRNITVTVSDDIYRAARVRAAAEDTSVSAVVREFLIGFAQAETEHERLKKAELNLRQQVGSFAAGDRLPREDLHMRRR